MAMTDEEKRQRRNAKDRARRQAEREAETPEQREARKRYEAMMRQMRKEKQA